MQFNAGFQEEDFCMSLTAHSRIALYWVWYTHLRLTATATQAVSVFLTVPVERGHMHAHLHSTAATSMYDACDELTVHEQIRRS